MKITSIILSAMIGLSLASCHDDLNTKPYDTFDADEVFSSKENAEMFVNGLYYILKDKLSPDDEANHGDGNTVIQEGSGTTFVQETFTSDNDFGWNIFGDLRSCNQAITNIETSANISQADKENLIGQAKFLRAALYYSNARKFGRLILIDKVLTPEDDLELPRTKTIKETYDAILKDLDDAAAMLPESAAQGYIAKGAAYALKAEVCLQGAAYLDNTDDKLDYYKQARKASEDLFALNLYSLDEDYGSMFRSLEGAQASNEIILATYYLKIKNTFQDTFMMNIVPNQGGTGKLSDDVRAKWPMESLEGWMIYTPSQELVDAYEVIDEDGQAKDWNQTSYYKNFRPGVDWVSHAIYDHRDARFYETIGYDSCHYFNSTLVMRKGGNMWWENNGEGPRYMTKTGYIYRKYVYEGATLFYYYPTDWCLVHARLGRSYLNYAEALLRLIGTSEDDGTLKSTAIDYINQVRTTHGKLPELDGNMTEQETWNRYKRERRVELVYENDYYWALLRWAKEENQPVVNDLNGKTPQAIIIAEDGKDFTMEDVPSIAAQNRRTFTSKRFLLPIPKSEVSTNSRLKEDQNPGWY